MSLCRQDGDVVIGSGWAEESVESLEFGSEEAVKTVEAVEEYLSVADKSTAGRS